MPGSDGRPPMPGPGMRPPRPEPREMDGYGMEDQGESGSEMAESRQDRMEDMPERYENGADRSRDDRMNTASGAEEMDAEGTSVVTAAADGVKSLADICHENGITAEEFLKNNDLSKLILVADVVYNLPKKV